MSNSHHSNTPEREVFQNLFDNYYEAIRNFLYYKSGEMELAEDLTQEAFLILWKKRESINPDKAKSYLYTIANNLFLNEIKHQKVVIRFQQQPVSNTLFESPQFLMEAEEFKVKLEKAISDLPEKNRSVFLMNRVEKMTYKEIADRLSLSVKAVEKRMHKALTELRKLSDKI
ncbi:MAG: RNA polymerase sigma-70 factor [Bacteroidia bacterium]|nr:RNA polymerase sigma-70 factor [Bacteroidia bacterium]